MFFTCTMSSFITDDGKVRDHKIELILNIPNNLNAQTGAELIKQITLFRNRIYELYVQQP